MSLTLFTRNLLELGTITAPAAPAFPKERLADRDRGPQWQAPSPAQVDIDLDLGAALGVLPATAWALVTHNVAVTVEIRTGTDGVTFGTLVDSAAPTGVDPFFRSIAQASSRYWRVRIPVGAVEAKIGELFLGIPITLPTPSFRRGDEAVAGNIRADESPGGYVWSVKTGSPRARRVYGWTALIDADWTLLQQAFSETSEGAKAFLLTDPDGVLRWMRWIRPEVFARAVSVGVRDTETELLEAL